MGIETWNVFPKILDNFARDGMPLPCSDINPRLKCPETRWARDFCIVHGGACEYKIEAHFDCLEQFYPKDKVMQLRKNFKPSYLDIPVSEQYDKYRHYYMYHIWNCKVNFESLF